MFLQIMGCYRWILIFPVLIKAFPCFQSPLVNLWPSRFNPCVAGITNACHYPSHSAFIIEGHMHIGGTHFCGLINSKEGLLCTHTKKLPTINVGFTNISCALGLRFVCPDLFQTHVCSWNPSYVQLSKMVSICDVKKHSESVLVAVWDHRGKSSTHR